MPKIELDVTLLLCTTEVLAEPGDRLMVFNGSVIGVMPRNTELTPAQCMTTPTSNRTRGSKPRKTFDPLNCSAWIKTQTGPFTTRQLNHAMGYTGTTAGDAASLWLSAQAMAGNLTKSTNSGRFAQYTHTAEPELPL